VIEYRLDVELALKSLAPEERTVVLFIHRDGLTARDAVKLAGVTHSRPDEYVTRVEVKLGREAQRRKLDDLVDYFL
jgi:DNA-directed RNA polymerase specialized sigma24 family protein